MPKCDSGDFRGGGIFPESVSEANQAKMRYFLTIFINNRLITQQIVLAGSFLIK